MTNVIQLGKLWILKLNNFATGIPTSYFDMSVYIHLLSVLSCRVRLSSSGGKHAQTVAQGLGKDAVSLKMLLVMQMPWQNHKQGKGRSLCQILSVIF